MALTVNVLGRDDSLQFYQSPQWASYCVTSWFSFDARTIINNVQHCLNGYINGWTSHLQKIKVLRFVLLSINSFTNNARFITLVFTCVASH